MTTVPLKLGPLACPGFRVQRSGIRWLREDGHRCRPGEVIAYCNIALSGRAPVGVTPPVENTHDFQVAFAPRAAGVLRRDPRCSHGGWIDHNTVIEWSEDFLIGHLDGAAGADPHQALSLLMVAGRRPSQFAEDRSGLLTGWHDRKRAWWGEAAGPTGTLVSLGICELLKVMLGERFAFTEMFEAVPGPAQVVFVPDNLQVPCARVVLEQLRRGPADVQAIAADIAGTLPAGPVVPTAADWIFAGTLLSALQQSPLTETYDVLTRAGLQRAGPADAVLLSLAAESPFIVRHRRLGYAVHLHDFRIAQLGPAVRAWFETHFERVRRSPADIQRDYRELVAALRAHSGIRILTLNCMSTTGDENIVHYNGLDAPLHDTLQSVRAKELNLMLHDLEHESGISIVDVDAIAADMGGWAHLPDGIHQSGAMQAEIRAEILRILRAQRIPGFGAPLG
ncbi:MAG: SGNH/GDSL hydrolase family protein [Nevskia sp.]|nr:SGNH/GDSL hydrolase family protein [Nevskia sp.]